MTDTEAVELSTVLLRSRPTGPWRVTEARPCRGVLIVGQSGASLAFDAKPPVIECWGEALRVHEPIRRGSMTLRAGDTITLRGGELLASMDGAWAIAFLDTQALPLLDTPAPLPERMHLEAVLAFSRISIAAARAARLFLGEIGAGSSRALASRAPLPFFVEGERAFGFDGRALVEVPRDADGLSVLLRGARLPVRELVEDLEMSVRAFLRIAPPWILPPAEMSAFRERANLELDRVGAPLLVAPFLERDRLVLTVPVGSEAFAGDDAVEDERVLPSVTTVTAIERVTIGVDGYDVTRELLWQGRVQFSPVSARLI